jgi:penicillin amidase
MFTFRRLIFILLSLLLSVVMLAGAMMPVLQRRSYPQVDGELRLPGLQRPVDVYRDPYGVPHIFAASPHDLFMAQGFVQAQDRFWQMDMWRHQATGRLSELLGDSTLEIDKYLQTLGWERVALAEMATMDADSRLILQAFADGVNAYIDSRSGAELSFEYFFLPIVSPGYQPAPWELHHSLAWAKAMAWDLGGNMDTEIERARLLADLPLGQVDWLFPAYDFETKPVIVSEFDPAASVMSPAAAQRVPPESLPVLASLQAGLEELDRRFGGGFEGIGSNSWAIHGSLTASGLPILANDPHLGAQLPSIWYEVGLHCRVFSAECPYDVAGFAFSSTPGVVIGHNRHIAWGFTNLGPDVMDLYLEKVNPDNPDQYQVNGEWVDMELVPVRINVAGGDPVDITVRYTRHGPVISDVSLSEFGDQAGIDLPQPYAIALRWTVLEPGLIFRSIWKMNRAQNWAAFQAAAMDFNAPSQNLLYADVEGNIGYQASGWMPIRQPGHDGMLPAPGWTDDYEWQGYVPFEQLPFALNPASGYIVTANNAVVGPAYPYTFSRQWAPGYRAQSIIDDIRSAAGPIDLAYVKHMQASNRDMNAELLVPILLQLEFTNPRLQSARSLLAGWDFQAHMDSAPAALFEVFWRNLLVEALHDDLPDYYLPGGGGAWFQIVGLMAADPDHPWWDDLDTPGREARPDILRRAFENAVAELEGISGPDPQDWSWGDLHTLTHRHSLMSNFPLVDRLFNVGPFRASGGTSIVNATGWNAQDETAPYEVRRVPSMRMIVDLSDMGNSLTVHLTGQSGHAGHEHYSDMTDMWRLVSYHPMFWDTGRIEALAEGHLQLMP